VVAGFHLQGLLFALGAFFPVGLFRYVQSGACGVGGIFAVGAEFGEGGMGVCVMGQGFAESVVGVLWLDY